jgi:NRPS condensation-like uncharacterized protein
MKMENVEDIYALSPVQQGILFHTLYAPGSGVYIEQIAWTIDGEIDISAFERAWQQVVRRHPILRTAFLWSGLDTPLQIVRKQVEIQLEHYDWRGISPTEQQARIESHLSEDRKRGYDLARAPLMRLALVRLTDDRYRFIWSHHHLLLDAWSVSSLLKEILISYEALSKNREIKLPESRPYRDYIAWLQRQDISKAEEFWRQTLAGFATPTSLRVEKPSYKISDDGDTYEEQQIQLSAETTAALRRLVRQHKLTLNTLVQGAWALLLSRYSGERDVIFGSVVSGRPAELAGVESMIGLFINTLPVRVEAPPEAELLTWMRGLQDRQVAGRQYEYSSLAQIQEWSSQKP